MLSQGVLKNEGQDELGRDSMYCNRAVQGRDRQRDIVTVLKVYETACTETGQCKAKTDREASPLYLRYMRQHILQQDSTRPIQTGNASVHVAQVPRHFEITSNNKAVEVERSNHNLCE